MMRAEVDLGAFPEMIDRGELYLPSTEYCSMPELCELLRALYQRKPVSPLAIREAGYDENVMLLPAGHQAQQIAALVAVMRGQIELVFHLEHDDLDKDDMIFAMGGSGLEHVAQWVKVHDVFVTDTDRPFLKHAGVTRIDDSRFDKYSRRLAALRAILDYHYPAEIEKRRSIS